MFLNAFNIEFCTTTFSPGTEFIIFTSGMGFWWSFLPLPLLPQPLPLPPNQKSGYAAGDNSGSIFTEQKWTKYNRNYTWRGIDKWIENRENVPSLEMDATLSSDRGNQ